MSLNLLSILNLRNIESAKIEPSPRLNILVGANGSGKTSVLEAIYLLGRGKSFRSAYSRRIVNYEHSSLTVFGKAATKSGLFNTLGIQINDGRFRAKLNGKFEQKSSTLASVIPLLFISPDGDKLIKGSPRQRRRFIDWGLFHVEHEFLSVWQRYNRILQQRNAILRQKSATMLLSWDKQLIHAALKLNQFRVKYVEELARLALNYMKQLLDIETIDFSYQSGWRRGEDYKDALRASIESDIRLGFTQKGPHRADLVMKIDGRPAAEYLSGGQQKLAACSLLLAQASVFNQNRHESCVILVDDLPSELDLQHRQLFMDLLYSIGGQVFVTATDSDLLQLSAYPEKKTFHVERGSVVAEREDGV